MILQMKKFDRVHKKYKIWISEAKANQKFE